MAADDQVPSDVLARVAERIRTVDQTGFMVTCGFHVRSYGEGKARAELAVTARVVNPNGQLHGGAVAALVDHAGTIAIMTADRAGRPGVTTDLNVTYLAPAPEGSTVVADATVLKIGKTMAFVTVDVRRVHDSVLIAQGRMTKFQG